MKTSICQNNGYAVFIASERVQRNNRWRSHRTILSDDGSSADRHCAYEPYAVPPAQSYMSDYYPRTASAVMSIQYLRHRVTCPTTIHGLRPRLCLCSTFGTELHVRLLSTDCVRGYAYAVSSAQSYMSDHYPRTASAVMPMQCLRHYLCLQQKV
jgi:hypothetical protein